MPSIVYYPSYQNLRICFNPEFLTERSAKFDFINQSRFILGGNEDDVDKVAKLYCDRFGNTTPVIKTNYETAEMIKYAANSFLALKISYINEIANLCEKVGADVHQVANGMGKDGRISSKFLHPGPGFGGSCFPKDTRALINIGEKFKTNLSIVKSVVNSNNKRKVLLTKKVETILKGNLKGKIISFLIFVLCLMFGITSATAAVKIAISTKELFFAALSISFAVFIFDYIV